MSSIVLDLQNEVTKPDCDIVSVLRKAHLIAIKLGLTDFDKWIFCEYNEMISDTEFLTEILQISFSNSSSYTAVGIQPRYGLSALSNPLIFR